MDKPVESNRNEEFLQWYVDMIENFPNTFAHYLSEDALLQWFGRSIKGPDRILYFIKTNMQGSKHLIGIQTANVPTENSASVPTEVNTKPSTSANKSTLNLTPESNVSTVNIDLLERDDFAAGDGIIIDRIPLRTKTDLKDECFNKSQSGISTLFETSGAIEFCRPCYKRGVAESKWERPCTLKVGYSGSLAKPINLTIKIIIYGDNMPCKRNLLPEFNACVQED